VTALWKKLNLKDDVTIAVVDAPDSFESEITTLEEVVVSRNLAKAATTSFFLVFATKLSEIEKAAKSIARTKDDDPIVWFAYPKGTSKRYRCEFNRDKGWSAMGEAGFEAVRQVAIDEDWSALRFRRVERIRSMTRSPRGAISKAGKKRTAKKA